MKMALCRTGDLFLKYTKPKLVNPCFLVLGPVNVQVRYAARKGYREKARKAKKEVDRIAPTVAKEFFLKKKIFSNVKTVNLKKPEPPSDDVIIKDNFNYVKYSLPEAVKLHREYHHPTVHNNPNAQVFINFEINMTGKTEFQFIKPFSGVASIPHPFVVSFKKEVLVFCDPEYVDLALSWGASVAGGDDVVKKIKEGLIQPSLYNYIIAHINFFPKLTVIRTLLKNQMPRAKQGTLTNDLKTAIDRFCNGIEYSCAQSETSKNIGFINCSVGLISMELDKLEENLKAVIKDIEKHKPPKKTEFISWMWCGSPPSSEKFSLDLSKYINVENKLDESKEEEEEVNEKIAREKLKLEYEEDNIMEKKI